MSDTIFDVIVVGAGHAGCEAALASARMGQRTLLLTLQIDSVAYLACNPAIGGTSKGHLVREIDALGGQMGQTADQTLIQMRMLNLRKGPAVHSSRAQVDKQAYAQAMRQTLEAQPGLTLLQAEVSEVCVRNGRVYGVKTAHGLVYQAPAVVIAAGVYMNSRIITGEYVQQTGPAGLMRSSFLGEQLASLGIPMRRFKTGTPPRVDGKTIDADAMQIQRGDEPLRPFSFLTDARAYEGFEQDVCYLTYTNAHTHAILRANLDRSPMYGGMIEGTGARYCPSIEDKIVRFADKDRHQLFVEPEGRYTDERYIQGFSTSMPYDVQIEALHTIPGLTHARIVRPGYAIEYDCMDGRVCSLDLMVRDIPGLFFAGQVVGSSGYEEAAAQGLIAGINAARFVQQKEPLLLTRMDGYIGVLIDDLVTKGTPEPYRMMTARAEYRLLLRQDNADLRLTQYGYDIGLASEDRYQRMQAKQTGTASLLAFLRQAKVPADSAQALCEQTGDSLSGGPWAKWLLRANVDIELLASLEPQIAAFDPQVRQQAEIEIKYEGYLARQQREIDRQAHMEHRPLPADLDYTQITGLRIEAKQKLNTLKPSNLGQASRISGVSPADIAVLSVYLERKELQA